MSARPSHARLPGLLVILAAAALLAVLAPARGHAADRVYWTNFDGPDPLTFADLAGGEAMPLNITGATAKVPNGVAIDPAGGRVYWANSTGSNISYANLDGSGGGELNTTGATVDLPIGVAIDPATRRIYWASEDADKISYARLDGTGGGDLNTTGATVNEPTAVVVDPGEGRIYWANGQKVGTIAYASLSGAGGADLPITGSAPLEYPLGLAIDQAARRIYWTNDENVGPISFAGLDGSGSRNLNTTGSKVANPYGLAVDPESGRAFWGNTVADSIGSARTDGSGGATLPLSIPKGSAPNFPVLYETPRPISAPVLSSEPGLDRRKKPKVRVGPRLSCAGGRFASDLVESFLYRAPVTVGTSLTRENAEITSRVESGNAVSPPSETLLSAKVPGDYRCQTVGSNIAGETTETSPPLAIFKLAKVKANRRNGTARLTLLLPGEPGALGPAGKTKGIAVPSRKAASGRATITVRPTGRRKAKLKADGKLSSVVRLAFTPVGGSASSLAVRVVFKRG